ncbi:MAG: hypothetical protein ACRCV0_02535, partial [Brevinema sp.]
VCQEMGRSSLPDKIALNHKLNGSCTHRDLMDKVQRSCSNKIIKLETVTREILKNIGQSSPSNSQISDLAKKIADENRLNGSIGNVYIWKDQLGRLSTKVIEETYVKIPFTRDEIDELKQGILSVKNNKISKEAIEKRMKQQISDGSIEVIQSSSQTTVISANSNSIENISKSYASEKKALLEWSKKLLPSINEKELINNWAYIRMWMKGSYINSLTEKQYSITSALKTIQIKKSHSMLNDLIELVRFAYSLDKKGARAFIFSNDKDSLQFLFDKTNYNSSMEYFNDLNKLSQDKLIQYIIQAFYELSVKYIPIVITDGSRSASIQVDRIISNKLKYYKEKLPKGGNSYKYIKALYDIYENNSSNQDLETILSKSELLDSSKKIIKDNYGDLRKTLTLFIPAYFIPSYHMEGQAVDLRDTFPHIETAKLIEKKSGGKYGKSNHRHINLL